MPKTPLSVTLEEANLLWLRARAAGQKSRGLSQALDDVLTEARRGGPGGEAPRSVVGTVDIAPEDPSLAHADGADPVDLRRLSQTSVRPSADSAFASGSTAQGPRQDAAWLNGTRWSPIRTRSSCTPPAGRWVQTRAPSSTRPRRAGPSFTCRRRWSGEVALLARAVRINLHRPVRAFFAGSVE